MAIAMSKAGKGKGKDTDPRTPIYKKDGWKVMPTHIGLLQVIHPAGGLVAQVKTLEQAKQYIAQNSDEANDVQPIPVDDQVLGEGAVGDASSYNDLAQAYHAAHKAWSNSGSYSNEEKTAYKQMEEIGKKLVAHPDNPRNKPAAKVAAAAQAAREHQDWKDSMHSRIASGEVRRGVRGYDAGLLPIPVDDQVLGHGAAGDQNLRPIPVDDAEVTTKYAERPKPAKWGGTSMALKTPSAVAEAYRPRDPEGFKRSFGKDADPRRQSYATPSGTAKVDEKLPPSDSLHSYEALTKLARRLKLQPGDVGSQLMPDGKYHAYAKAHGMDAELEPIPVGDDAEVSTKYAEKPKAPKPFSSHVFKSEEEARKAYGAKDPEGFKRSFGKDAAGRIITPDLARTGGVGSWKPSGTYRGKTCEYDYSVAGHVLGNVMMPAGSRKDYSGTLHTSWPGEQRKFANEQSAKSWVEHEVKNYITANDSLKPIPIKDSFNGLVGKLERDGKSKAYATKIAGKVTAEKSGAKDAEEFRDPDSNIWSPFGDPNVPASLLNTYQKLFDEYYAINGRARQAPGSPTAKAAAEAAYKKSRAAFEACRAASRKARKTAPANDCCYFVMS